MSLRIYGATSGYIELDAPAVANSASVTLPTTSGVLATQIGYQFVQRLYYSSNATFTKENYPWLRAIRISLVGGGGAGGGAGVTTSTQGAAGSGGGAGGYAERFYTNISSLSSSVTISIGLGGTGVSAGVGNSGGTTSFGNGGDGWYTRASGGNGAGWNLGSTTGGTLRQGGDGGAGINGDFISKGSPGQMFIIYGISAFNSLSGNGGDSIFAGGGLGAAPNINDGYTGQSGQYGSGGGGSINLGTQGTARAGGNGGNGLVILDLFA